MIDIIVEEDDTMINGIPLTIVVARPRHAHTEETVNRGISGSMTRVRRSIVRMIVVIIEGNLVIIGITRDLGRSRHHQMSWWHQ